nr:hybrid sensor histidine kinase/response regulator [uncultured Sulfurimonas sp.]
MIKKIAALKELAKGKTVLLVEDDEAVMESLKTFLSKFFLEVHTQMNVEDALFTYKKLIQQGEPVMLVTDIQIGSKTGIELTYLIKKIVPKQKVIAISAYDDKKIFVDAIKCGVNRFILKPVDLDDMLNALIDLMQEIDYDLELEKNKKLLEDSKEYALKLLDEQKNFLKNAIHEINTPLAVIITNIDLLKMQGIDNESLDSIEAGARIIQNSYEDMTYLMQHNHIVYPRKNINLVNFIKSRIEYFKCIAKENELNISLIVGVPNLEDINFNESRLQRIIDNTLSNAIKYSYKSTTINVSIGLQNACVFFEIKNQGPMISQTQKIFERFYRETSDKGGLGLGLSIVHNICQEENINIDVKSSQHNVTSFRYIFSKEHKTEGM